MLELDSCAMAAARLAVEADSAARGPAGSPAGSTANIARDCDMLSRRYGDISRRLASKLVDEGGDQAL